PEGYSRVTSRFEPWPKLKPQPKLNFCRHIAVDAVGGSEIIGVTKLLFGKCMLTSTEASTSVAAGGNIIIDCSISGADSNDAVSATLNHGNGCFEVEQAEPGSGVVGVNLHNDCIIS
ncbi:MAG: hypothetical protein ACREBU_05310, partial [Nitrososphaera sp.]